MSRINMSVVFRALTGYAIERQNGIERHQPADGPPWQEERRRWIKNILQDMAGKFDEGKHKGKELSEKFDLRMKQARECAAVEITPVPIQMQLIRSLRIYISSLESSESDTRPEIWDVRALAEDMLSHLPWDPYCIGVDWLLSHADYALMQQTAHQSICFTRISVYSKGGPCDVSYVPGQITEKGDSVLTGLVKVMAEQYPEVENWTAACMVYRCGSYKYPREATEWDLSLIGMVGDRFLCQPEARLLFEPIEMMFSSRPAMTEQSAERTMTWQILR